MIDNFIFYIECLVQTKALWTIPLSFVAGFLLSLSPCSLPLVPVILGIAEIEETTTRKRAFLLSLLFVSGIVAVYVFLGLLASFFGVFFGSIAKHVATRLITALIIITFSLVSLDLIKLNINARFNVDTRRYGVFGVFLLGIVVGASVTACVLPVLGSILVIIAQKQDVLFGVVSLIFFAMGMGSVYLLFAMGGREIFCHLESKPHLMLVVKKILGVIMLLIGLFYLVGVFL